MKIVCGGAQCGEYLGVVGPSAVGMKLGRSVWFIQPGWQWVFPPGIRGQPLGSAILEFVGDGRSEQQLVHEAFGVPSSSNLDPRVGVAREAFLPIVVRCPHCRRLRYVTPEAISTPILLRA